MTAVKRNPGPLDGELGRNPFQDPPLLEKHVLRGLQDHCSRRWVVRLVERYGQHAFACRLLACIGRE